MKFLNIALLVPVASAQQALWAQCGGKQFTGSVECVSESTCIFVNEWYSQCQPGSAPPAATTTTSTKKPCSTKPPVTDPSAQYFFTFGDSYSSTGFNITTGDKPSASNPLGNPPFPGYPTSVGPNWIADLVSKYNTSLLLNYNLAYGGATVNASIVAPYLPTVLSVIDQVEEFSDTLASHPSYSPWTSANTIFGIWEGVNDVGNSWYEPDTLAINTELVKELFEQIDVMYEAGGRNFAILTVPPTYRSPFIKDGDNAEATIAGLRASIEDWNQKLSVQADAFAATHSDAVVKITDTGDVFNPILDAGGAAADCFNGDGVTCLWANNYHPGVKIQDAVAKAVAEDWAGTFFQV